MSKWCSLSPTGDDEVKFVSRIHEKEPVNKAPHHALCPDTVEVGWWLVKRDWVEPEKEVEKETGPVDNPILMQAEALVTQDDRRIAVSARRLIPESDRESVNAWLKSCYDAQDKQVEMPEPPVIIRRFIDIPDQESDRCVIQWKEFTGTHPGWGFSVTLRRKDIAALGLKVYDENGNYLYALSFAKGRIPGNWTTETPAGFATDKKIERQFEVVAGSAPVTEKVRLTADVDHRSFIVKWSPAKPVTR